MSSDKSLEAARKMHSDVLESNPADHESKERLAEEIKSRGNLALKHDRLHEADMLYSHAITVLPTHAIYSNRSMCRLKQKKYAEALSDAEECIKLDKTFAKGYYRKGAVLEGQKKWGPSYDAYKLALERTKKGKEYDKLNKTTEKMYKRACQQMAEGDGPAPAPAPAKKKSADSSTSGMKEDVVVVDDEDEAEMKGYKTLSDGRKTSYFHTELDETAKRLLAEQAAPKKLDAAAVAELERQNSEKAPGEGSVWNSAKTFEDKDMTKWAHAKLEELLKAVGAELPAAAGDGKLSVTTVKDLDGDASTPMIRGTKRFIYDLRFKAEWKAEFADGKKVKGAFECPDVSSDSDPTTFEIIAKITTKTASLLPTDEGQAALLAAVKASVSAALVAFHGAYNAL